MKLKLIMFDALIEVYQF